MIAGSAPGKMAAGRGAGFENIRTPFLPGRSAGALQQREENGLKSQLSVFPEDDCWLGPCREPVLTDRGTRNCCGQCSCLCRCLYPARPDPQKTWLGTSCPPPRCGRGPCVRRGAPRACKEIACVEKSTTQGRGVKRL